MTTKPQSQTASHTPGPWYVERFDEPGLYIARAETTALLAKLRPVHPRGTMEANARLIASAPDLLAALLPMLNGTVYLTDAHVEAARAAIQKATRHLP